MRLCEDVVSSKLFSTIICVCVNTKHSRFEHDSMKMETNLFVKIFANNIEKETYFCAKEIRHSFSIGRCNLSKAMCNQMTINSINAIEKSNANEVNIFREEKS